MPQHADSPPSPARRGVLATAGLSALAAPLLGASIAQAPACDPLPLWREGPRKRAGRIRRLAPGMAGTGPKRNWSTSQ